MSNRIPETIRHADFLAALKPLLDLLGVQSNEIYTDIHITSNPDSDAIGRIAFDVVARAEDDDADRPKGIPLADAPQEYAELSYHVVVKVV